MENYVWTRHSEYKLQQYALSKQRIRRVIRHPDRIEKSIVPGMIAAMQIAGTSKNRQEIWTMYEIRSENSSCDLKIKSKKNTGLKNFEHNVLSRSMSPAQRFRFERQEEFRLKNSIIKEDEKCFHVISVWRYPGTSSERDPIPKEILEDIRNIV